MSRTMKATLNEQERFVVLGARIVRAAWRSNDVFNKETLAELVASALYLAGHPELARRMKP